MNFADQKTVERLRAEFPVGCRIVLDEMDDRQAPPIGTQGTCNGVDDAGNVLVSWDTGSHLNVAYGADSCHRVATDAEVKVCRSTALVKRDRPAHVAPGAEQSLTVTTISSRHSAEGRTSRSATAAERRKH